MELILVLLPLALLLAGLGVAAFVWAVRRGQFDDLETPALRILSDDEPISPQAPSEAGGGTKKKGDR